MRSWWEMKIARSIARRRRAYDPESVRFCLGPNSWNMTLARGEVHLWLVGLDGPIAEYDSVARVLSPTEKDRGASFCLERDRLRFVAVHSALRYLVAAYTETRPEDLQFRYNPHGKPSLAPGETKLAFNLAHSEGQALYAICADHEIGVDIERVREFGDLLQIARQQFAPEEYDQLATTPDHARCELFFRYWTLKEAVVKATGAGLGQLKDFRVRLSGYEEGVLEPVKPNPVWHVRWHLQSFEPAQGYKGALAVPGSISNISARGPLNAGELIAFCREAVRQG